MRWFWLCLALLLTAPEAHAMESAPVRSQRDVATLVTSADSFVAGKPVGIGLRLRLASGWHTYWQNPGDAGQAPALDLTLRAGATAGPIAWPAPQRQAEGPLVTYGYSGDLLLPREVTAAGAAPLVVTAHASWLVCSNICVPEEAEFHLTLPPGSGAASAEAPLFAAAAQSVPRASPFAARFAADGALTLSGDGLSPEAVAQAVFVPDTEGTLDNAAAQPLTLRQGALTLKLPLTKAAAGGADLHGVLLLRDPHGSASALAVTAQPGGPPAPDTAADPAMLSFGRMLALAFLGGVILNLMPCVFPVLAMKALAIARLSGTARAHVQMHAVSYTLGVVLAFAAIGGTMLGLRAAGSAAGWGFQFQSPVFVAGMCWLLFAVGLSQSGVFHVDVGMAGAGHGLASRRGHLGSFFTGLLAVVVATPCTAPFMGAAIAGALAASAPVLLAVFLAMGLGLAAPYALLAAVPRLATSLPRPGRWMAVTKQALAFPMYAAAAWLVWVVSQEAGPAGVLATAAGLVLLGFAGWAAGLAQSLPHARQGRRVAQSAALAAGLAALAVLSGIATAPAWQPAAATAAASGEKFSVSRLAELRAAGRPVFVNLTAAWCITCLVNERVALSPPAVRDAFAAHGVAYLKGDWTRQDPDITSFLRAQRRDGVPLYIYYPAGGGPDVLPQILTEGTVLAAIDGSGA
jgi:thiol:disulfide interchange protein DsbD